jgi:uncharacterized phage infection (PIP) family protein YhgE
MGAFDFLNGIGGGNTMAGGMPSTVATAAQVGPSFAALDPKVAMIASMLGQAGAAISPEGSWGAKLGGAAANMGSQRLQQMANEAAEKRQMEFYKKLFEGKTPAQTEALKGKVLSKEYGGVGNLDPLATQTPTTAPQPLSASMYQPEFFGDIFKYKSPTGR